MSEALRVLAAPTPPEWVDAACAHWRTLLIDHANCEKKAASSALALIFAYPEDADLVTALSRLAREELRHFEQVAQLMRRLEVPFERQRPGRYAAGLRAVLRWSCCSPCTPEAKPRISPVSFRKRPLTAEWTPSCMAGSSRAS